MTTTSQPWGQKPKADTSAWSNRELYDDNARILKEQDDALDSMYTSVTNTGAVAKAIGEEAESHIGLLDDLNNAAGRNDAKIRNAAVAAKDVEITSSTKLLWAIIILLIVTMIVLLIVALK